jgi:hypothetical protein
MNFSVALRSPGIVADAHPDYSDECLIKTQNGFQFRLAAGACASSEVIVEK